MKKMKFLVTVLTVILIFGACSKKDELQNNNHFITLEQAIKIAKENVDNTITDEKKSSLRSDDFTPLNTISLEDDSNTPTLYIINYRKNGDDYFNIISADNRLDYVLAFGEEIIRTEDIREGVEVWINEQINLISYIRTNNLSKYQVLTEIIQARVLPEEETDCCEECPNYPECEIRPWIGCGDPNIDCEYDPCEGISLYISVGPLMTTRWGQGCDYNDDCPVLGCNQLPCFSNRALTGCVATAMSQIIRHHEHPVGYNYANMLDDYAALRADANPANDPTLAEVDAVAELMSDGGVEVNMNYGCGFSGAFTCNEVPGAMTGFFNYGSANNCQNYSTASFNIIRNDIDQDRPVLFRGDGHAWVCDGYRMIRHCFEYDEENHLVIVYFLRRYYHMNWGWDGIANGFFDYSAANGGFPTTEQFINNINP